MLAKIRDKLSTWVIGILITLVAVPLVFMGLGDYQTAQETFAFKIDDTTVSTSKLEQEVFQYRQALDQNFQGNIPPIYTSKFIRSLTLDYMIRTILLDKTARSKGLVFHNDSIINEIYNTPSFRDENGFNKDKYLSQLFKIGMDSKSYEGYIFQKGITDQLKKSITDTSFVTKSEKTDLLKFRHHERNVTYKILRYNKIKDSINITEEILRNHYTQNKENYMSPAKGTFNYIDVDKNDLIKKIPSNDSILKERYDENLADGMYRSQALYSINHILIPDINESSKIIALEALSSIKKGMSFSDAALKYSTDEETLASKGYLGEFALSDMPDYFQSVVRSMKENEISELIESDNGFHILSLKNIQSEKTKTYSDVKNSILTEYRTEIGTREYFDLIDSLSERNFTKQISLKELAGEFNLDIKDSKLITVNEGKGIFNYDFVRAASFSDQVISQNETSDLIYVNEDRFIIIEKSTYQNPEVLSFDESKSFLTEIVTTLEADKLIKSKGENIRNDLNADINSSSYNLLSFKGTIDSDKINKELKEAFFSSNPNSGYRLYDMSNKDILIFVVDNIIYPEDLSQIDKSNDYFNFMNNTRSESEYNLFYNLLKSKADIKLNEEYLTSN